MFKTQFYFELRDADQGVILIIFSAAMYDMESCKGQDVWS